MKPKPGSGIKRALKRAKQLSVTPVSWLLSAVAVVALLGGLGVFGWQVYHWVNEGAWHQITVVDALSGHGINMRAPVPNSWTLVHRFVEWLPLTASGLVGGTFLQIFATGLREKARRALE